MKTAAPLAGLVVALAFIAAPAQASRPPTLSTQATPVSAVSVRASGRVPGVHMRTPVVVQQRRTRYDRWVRTTRTRTTTHGTFSFLVPLADAQRLTYRVCARSCSRPHRLAIRRADASLVAVTWPSQTVPGGDPLNPPGGLRSDYYPTLDWDYAAIRITGKADPRAAGASVTLQELIAGQWVAPPYTDPRVAYVQPDGTFTLDASMEPLGQRHAQLRLVTSGTDVVGPSVSQAFTTLSWKHVHLSQLPSTGPHITTSISEFVGMQAVTENLESPQSSTTFDVGGACSKLEVRPGLLPSADANARMSAGIAVGGSPVWTGEVARPSGAYYTSPSLTLPLNGASSFTLSSAPVSGSPSTDVWYDAYATCAY